MSPAREHRERHALAAVATPSNPVDPAEEGGQAPVATAEAFRAVELDVAPSPARAHRLQQAALVLSAADDDVERAAGLDPAVAQIVLRLTHDLRRLKDIKSIKAKIAAKRDMLPAYRTWIEGLLDAAQRTGEAAPDEVLPTIMVWAIDTGDWDYALRLAEHVIGHDVPLPSRYQRDAATLVVEEIAIAAIAQQSSGNAFPLDVLEQVESLTAHADMHDEVRAKLMKAIGAELARAAEAIDPTTPAFRPAGEAALVPLRRAQELHDRAGAKDRIKRLEKALAALPADTDQNTEQPGAPPAA